ncbi:unnamed protein product [Polarella glacialis]|uniref:Uncharacterized protein n=1 Tax=Polarella glacialis TaxID=89957 RepID=A0A813JF00_POLGL|nr:unnamed protein product [Polarella glacialis]
MADEKLDCMSSCDQPERSDVVSPTCVAVTFKMRKKRFSSPTLQTRAPTCASCQDEEVCADSDDDEASQISWNSFTDEFTSDVHPGPPDKSKHDDHLRKLQKFLTFVEDKPSTIEEFVEKSRMFKCVG